MSKIDTRPEVSLRKVFPLEAVHFNGLSDYVFIATDSELLADGILQLPPVRRARWPRPHRPDTFQEAAQRSAFLADLPEQGEGYRSCKPVGDEVLARMTA